MAKALRKLLDEIKSEYGKQPSMLLMDQGKEFEGATKQLLQDRGITIKRTLASAPWSNGTVERMNHRIKAWLFKRVRTKGQSWVDHLKHIQDVSNKSLLRSTGFTPAAALKLDKAGRATLRERVLRSQEEGGQLTLPDYPVGLAVRVKIPKNVLQKSTTPSWSSVIYKVLQAYRGRTPMGATRYRISRPRSDDLHYNCYDLQPVVGGPPAPIPGETSSHEDEYGSDDDGSDVASAAKAQVDKVAESKTTKDT